MVLCMCCAVQPYTTTRPCAVHISYTQCRAYLLGYTFAHLHGCRANQDGSTARLVLPLHLPEQRLEAPVARPVHGVRVVAARQRQRSGYLDDLQQKRMYGRECAKWPVTTVKRDTTMRKAVREIIRVRRGSGVLFERCVWGVCVLATRHLQGRGQSPQQCAEVLSGRWLHSARTSQFVICRAARRSSQPS
jgi:hypothetical protein